MVVLYVVENDCDQQSSIIDQPYYIDLKISII